MMASGVWPLVRRRRWACAIFGASGLALALVGVAAPSARDETTSRGRLTTPVFRALVWDMDEWIVDENRRRALAEGRSPRATQVPSHFSPVTRAALELLYVWPGFACESDMRGPAFSPAFALTRTLVRQPDGLAALRWLVVHGNAPARVYAYTGLVDLDHELGRVHAVRLAEDSSVVEYWCGCIGDERTVDVLASYVEPGELGRGAVPPVPELFERDPAAYLRQQRASVMRIQLDAPRRF